MPKKLDLYAELVHFTKKDGTQTEFMSYYVLFQGVKHPFELTNRVSKQIIEQNLLPTLKDEDETIKK